MDRAWATRRLTRSKKVLLWTAGAITMIVPVGVGILTAPRLRAQVQPADLPAFEVASVKANKSGEMGGQMRSQPGGRLTVTNQSLRHIIRNAYQVQDLQIVDAPPRIAAERFDLLAKAPGDVPPVIGSLSTAVRRLNRLLKTQPEVRS
jgi:hypothetical protein